MNEESAGVRLDKWLWAARFFRTRSLARTAIEAGHVRYDEQRPKVSKNVQVGAQLRIRRGQED
ncbi:MAG: RNA-binding protein, partial [Algiphilus sp.]